ncbi:MAG: DUF3098 domain-containing protein [Thermoflexibacter sp.]|jgi:hypothetical protein|nr:DUF3098 domain-containing protein [Thermoflexibacter sp.]
MSAKTVKNPIPNVKKTTIETKKQEQVYFAFAKENYRFMLIGIGAILLGFVIMSLDKEPHGFGFLGLTLGPIVVVLGFLFQFFAIFYKNKTKE